MVTNFTEETTGQSGVVNSKSHKAHTLVESGLIYLYQNRGFLFNAGQRGQT